MAGKGPLKSSRCWWTTSIEKHFHLEVIARTMRIKSLPAPESATPTYIIDQCIKIIVVFSLQY
jgi:hypothetical protein